ncbi:MAG: TetR/AcrR family transcriptional regulator [bacterium]
MKSKRGDRRVGRTRRALHEALRSLILQKGYDHVTVQDVIDRADVGRATFYAHFQDKDDLLMSGFEEMLESLRSHMAALLRGEERQLDEALGVSRALFDHAAGHRREYRALVGSRSGGALLKFAQKALTSLVREHLDQAVTRRRLKPVVPVEVTAHYAVSTLLALLTWWLDNDLPYAAEQMAQMFERLTRPAVAAALGVRL